MNPLEQSGEAQPNITAAIVSCPALRAVAAWTLLALLTVAAYLPVLQGGFIWDDDAFVTNNPLIQQADGLYRFWFTTQATDYFPLTSSMLWVEWRLWAGRPFCFHLVNLLLHAVSAVLWWHVLVRLKLPGSWLAAAIFALHPVNVESVAWITERKNTLAMVFFALTLLAYVRFEDTGRRRWYGIALGAFLLSLLAKAAAVPLPVALLGLAWWRRGRPNWRDIQRSLPFFAVSLLLGLVTIWFQYHRAIVTEVVRDDSLPARLAGAGWAIWFYLYKALFPFNLGFVYPRWVIDPGLFLSWLPPGLWLAVLAAFWHYRRNDLARAGLFAFGFYGLMLLPVLGFLNIYFMKYSLVADHWQYFSIIAPAAFVAAGFTMAMQAVGAKWLQTLVATILLAGLGTLTWRQAGIYQSTETLWRDTLAKNPGAWIAHHNLGTLLFQRGQRSEAIEHYRAALRLVPNNMEVINNLGCALIDENQSREGLELLHRVVAANPTDPVLTINLGRALAKTAQYPEAIACYQYALKLQPDSAKARVLLSKALVEVREAVRLNPNQVELLNCLAWLLATSANPEWRNGAEAVQLAERAAQLTQYLNSPVLDTLGAAYAEAGRWQEAIATAQKAIALAESAGNKKLARQIRGHLEAYQAGRPVSE